MSDVREYVRVVPEGTVIYTGWKDRAAFDCIKLPVTDHGEQENGHLLTKSVSGPGVLVVFQYWVKLPERRA